uniref:Uncharacterized protein n=1 Tax=Arundo donax TaxID=35708 RepID=A0A0A8ZV38_ARUDO
MTGPPGPSSLCCPVRLIIQNMKLYFHMIMDIFNQGYRICTRRISRQT